MTKADISIFKICSGFWNYSRLKKEIRYSPIKDFDKTPHIEIKSTISLPNKYRNYS